MNERREFLKTIAMAPVAIKYASLTSLLVPPSVVPLAVTKRIFEDEVFKYMSTEHWRHILVRDPIHVPARDVVREDDSTYTIPAQYVTHLTAERIPDGTNFYATISIRDSELHNETLIRAHCAMAVARFDGWKDCGCKVGIYCRRHGGLA
jgi:hypothetical protein